MTLGIIDGEQADFGAEREKTIVGDLVASEGRRTVAVEAGADGAAVAEDERGGAVPRLVERLVILVKFFHLGRGWRLSPCHAAGTSMSME